MAANSYTNSQIYIVVKEGEVLPTSLEDFRPPGEGTNNGETLDGRVLFKDQYIGKDGIQEMRDLVHAEDAGVLDLKTAAEMRELLKAESQAVEL